MKILGSGDFLKNGSVVTIGSYDGVHYGHRKILDILFEKSNQYDVPSVVLTLDPHPRKVLNLDISKLRLLNSLEEKCYLLDKCGLDVLYVAEFNKEFSELSGERYVREYLVNRLGVRAVIIGYDHHFGKDRCNGYAFLVEMGEKYNFDVFEIPKQDIDFAGISSTVIRDLLRSGEVEKANKYLCEPYLFISEVDKDGYIAINEELKLIPPAGKYNVLIEYGEKVSKCTLEVDELGKIRLEGENVVEGGCVVKIVSKK